MTVNSTEITLSHTWAVWDTPEKDDNNLDLLVNQNSATGTGEDV